MSTQQFYKSGAIWIHRPDPYFFSSKQIISYLFFKVHFQYKKSRIIYLQRLDPDM